MSKLLLLVHSEADVAHLDGAAQAILNSAITGVWVVFSPAITVNAGDAAAKLEAEITQLRTTERAAADRGDYAAAAGYKTQREGKELDRAKVLRDAWKTVPAEERQAKTKAIFGSFGDTLKTKGLNVRITGHSDHYDREQWVAMLNSLSGVWFKEFTAGEFLVGWPEAVARMVKRPHFVTGMTTTERIAEIDKEAPKPKSRHEELQAMHGMKRRVLAKSLGIDPDGKPVPEMIELILAAEEKKAEPALAEY